jgi:hypothetical protein
MHDNTRPATRTLDCLFIPLVTILLIYCIRCAYELNLLTSQRPRTVLEQASTHTSTQSELEYLEVFDFFNYPRLNAISAIAANGIGVGVEASPVPPTTVDQNPIPTPSFRGTPAPAFVVPNPESDWLIFKPPYE